MARTFNVGSALHGLCYDISVKLSDGSEDPVEVLQWAQYRLSRIHMDYKRFIAYNSRRPVSVEEVEE